MLDVVLEAKQIVMRDSQSKVSQDTEFEEGEVEKTRESRSPRGGSLTPGRQMTSRPLQRAQRSNFDIGTLSHVTQTPTLTNFSPHPQPKAVTSPHLHPFNHTATKHALTNEQYQHHNIETSSLIPNPNRKSCVMSHQSRLTSSPSHPQPSDIAHLIRNHPHPNQSHPVPIPIPQTLASSPHPRPLLPTIP